MAEQRQRRAQRAEDVDLPGRVVDVLVAAEDMGDGHVPVVDDDGEVVGGHAVRPQDDQVVDLAVGDRDRALDQVVPGHFTVGRIRKAHDGFDALGHRRQRLARGRAPAAVVQRLFATRTLGFAHGVQLFRRAVAAVGAAGGDELLHHRVVALQALHLVDGAFVVVQAQPGHGREDLVHRILRGTRHVGVFDAQHELPAVVARIGPGIQRGARRAQVQETRGRRRDAGADLLCHGVRRAAHPGHARGRPSGRRGVPGPRPGGSCPGRCRPPGAAPR